MAPSPTRSPRDGDFLVLGAGGLGCPVLLGLASQGASRLTIVDDDLVDASNLQRQVLYDVSSVGAPKVEAARRRLRGLNPRLEVETVQARLDEGGLERLMGQLAPGTVVFECTDDPALKFLVNDLALRLDLPAVIGGVIGWHGQALALRRGSACYRCYFEAPPPREFAPACAAVGVVGAVAGQVGSLMALLGVRLAGGEPRVAGRLHVLDGLAGSVRALESPPRAECAGCALLDARPEFAPTPACATPHP